MPEDLLYLFPMRHPVADTHLNVTHVGLPFNPPMSSQLAHHLPPGRAPCTYSHCSLTSRATSAPFHPGPLLLKSLYPSTAAAQSGELPNPSPPLWSQCNSVVALQQHTELQFLLLFSIVRVLVYRHFRWTPSQADFLKHESFPQNPPLDLCAYP